MLNINRHYISPTRCVYEHPMILTINNAYISLSSINWFVCEIHMDCAVR